MMRIPFLLLLSTTALIGCKSRYGFTDVKPEGAVTNNQDAITSPSVPGQGAVPNSGGTSIPPGGNTVPSNTSPSNDTSSNPTDTTSSPTDGVPSAPGGPVAGIEIWQDGVAVSTVSTGKMIQFKPTSWTRDTSATAGCDINRGIVQASWTIGSRPSADIQRFAGQDCRLFEYAGTFTKAGNVTVQLDVISADGEQAHAETVITVVGGDATSTTPTQK